MPNGTSGGIHLGDAILRILGDMGPLNKSLGDIEGTMGKVGQRLGNLGQSMTKAVTLPIAAGLGAAVYKATDFDSAMRNLNSVAQHSEDQFADLSDRVLDFSADVTAGAGDIAGAMTDVAAAGYDAEDSFTIIQSAMLGAEAGMAEVEQTAGMLTATIASYGMEVGDSSELMDKFLQMVNLGRMDLPDLAVSIGQVLPFANALGVSVDEVGAAMAVLTNKGISTAEAATALKGTFSGLISPSEELQELIERLGYDSATAWVAADGLDGVMQTLGEHTDGSAEATANLFHNLRAQLGVLNLAEDQADDYAIAVQQMGDAEGAVARAREQQQKSFQYQLKLLKGSFDTILITIGEKLLPVLTDLVKSLAPIFQSFTDLPDPVIKVGLAIAAVAAAIGPLLMVLGPMISGAAAVAGAIGGIAGTVSGILPILAAVGLAAGALYAAWRSNFLGIRDITKNIANKIPGFLSTAKEKLAGFASKVSETFEAVKGWISEKWAAAMEIIQPLIEEAAAAITPVLQEIGSAVTAFWEAVSPKLIELGGIIREKLAQAFEVLATIVQTVVDIVTPIIAFLVEFIRAHGDEIRNVFGALFNGIVAAARIFGSLLGGLVKAVLSLLTGDFEGFKDNISEMFSNMWSAVVELVEAIGPEFIGAVVTLLGELSTAVGQKLGELITSVIEPKLREILDRFQRLWAEIRDLPGRFIEGIKQKVRQFCQGIIDAVGEKVGAIVEKLKSPFQQFLDWAGGLWQKGWDLAEAFMKGILAAIQHWIEEAKKLLSKVRDLFPGSPVARTGPLSKVIDWHDFIFGDLPNVTAQLEHVITPILQGMATVPIAPMPRVATVAPAPSGGGVTIRVDGNLVLSPELLSDPDLHDMLEDIWRHYG